MEIKKVGNNIKFVCNYYCLYNFIFQEKVSLSF